MRTSKKNALLSSIELIYEKSKNSEMKEEVMVSLKNELKLVSNYLKTTPQESFIFSIIININFSGDSAYFKDIYKHMNIPAIQMISKFESFDTLVKKGYITKRSGRDKNNESQTNKHFLVNPQLSQAIVKNYPCPVFKDEKIETTIDLLEKINSLIQECVDNNLNSEELMIETSKSLDEYPDFIFFKTIKNFELNFEQSMLLYLIVWKAVLGMDGVMPSYLIDCVTTSMKNFLRFTQSLYNGSNPLIINDLIESKGEGFLGDVTFALTQKSIRLLKKDNIIIPTSGSLNRNDSIKAADISTKSLFYNEKENEQLTNLQDLLQNEKYSELQIRLKAKNLPLSLNVLLFGGAGTGKTESVFQLAKSSGREIIKVDISSTKSKWFGDSEKLIKSIFTDYANYAEKCDITPILLFNEADAILSKRTSESNSSTHKTENSIQNILLEELENFEGIFFATTNMAQNLDSAFDRRFLYKIEFTKPELKQRISIWESKLPNLPMDSYPKLASEFEFSGGQIDNIVRKCEINQVLYDTIPSFETIESYCISEKNEQSKTEIGFLRNEP